MLKYIGVNNMVDLINAIGLKKLLLELSEYIEEDYKRWDKFERKPRPASHSKEGVVEIMPECDGANYGFKFVNNHPDNHKVGLQSVIAFGMYADMQTGYPILLSELTLATALRTAATSVLVAKYLARKDSKIMAMIGTGSQSEFQAIGFKTMLGIERIQAYDRDQKALQKFVRNMQQQDINVETFTNGTEAAMGADIITTATSDKVMANIVSDNMVFKGVHINAIGGDCQGKTELQKEVLLRGDVFVELVEQTREEGEIQQMPADFPVTELWELFSGKKKGRTAATQITIFDSVGFAIEDFSMLRYLQDKTDDMGFYTGLDILVKPEDPRDLFSLL